PSGIAVGVDRAIWFTKAFSFPPGNRISRFGADGSLADFPIPTAIAQPSEIVLGIDRSLWFTEYGGNQIGRIGQDGTITEFPIPTRGSEPIGITVGPDGNLWFVENGGRVYIEGAVPEPQPNNIARITAAGQITEFLIPTPNSGPTGITLGPDGALWFTETNGNKIGRFVPPDGPPQPRRPKAVPFHTGWVRLLKTAARVHRAENEDSHRSVPIRAECFWGLIFVYTPQRRASPHGSGENQVAGQKQAGNLTRVLRTDLPVTDRPQRLWF